MPTKFYGGQSQISQFKELADTTYGTKYPIDVSNIHFTP